MQHAFINRNLDSKPIKDLLLEYKAEVVEEVVDDETEVSVPLMPPKSLCPAPHPCSLTARRDDNLYVFSPLQLLFLLSYTLPPQNPTKIAPRDSLFLYVYLVLLSTILCLAFMLRSVLFCQNVAMSVLIICMWLLGNN